MNDGSLYAPIFQKEDLVSGICRILLNLCWKNGFWDTTKWGEWDIWVGVLVAHNKRFTYFRNNHFEVGHKSKMEFWHNIGCGDRSLKKAYPELCSIIRLQEALIVDLLVLSNGILQWNVSIFKNVQDWEIDAFSKFYNLIYSTHTGGREREFKTRFLDVTPKKGGSTSAPPTKPWTCITKSYVQFKEMLSHCHRLALCMQRVRSPWTIDHLLLLVRLL